MVDISKDLTFKIYVFREKNIGNTSLIQDILQKRLKMEAKPPKIINIEPKHLTITPFKFVL